VKPRYYQLEAEQAVFRHWDSGRKSAMIVAATGTGKTVMFSRILKQARDKYHGRGLMLAHREELVSQAADKINSVSGLVVDIEMAEKRADAGHMFQKADVICASTQTLLRRGCRWKDIAVLVIDEAHHYVSESWRALIGEIKKQNPNVRIVGVTATPKRLDQEALGQVFEDVVYEYGIASGIADGYLVPIRELRCHVDGLDFSRARSTAGDLNQRDVAEISGAEGVLHEMALGIARSSEGKKSIVFAAPGFKTDPATQQTFRVADRLTEMLNERYWPGEARLITDATDKDLRRELIRQHKAGAYKCLVNIGIATEGYDDPTIEVVHIARATTSEALYTQMVGRGTRVLPGVVDHIDDVIDRQVAIAASAKPSLKVVDYVGNAGKHKLVTVTDIMRGNRSPEVAFRASQIIAARSKDGTSTEIDDAFGEAEKQIKAEKDDHDRKLAIERRKAVVATGSIRFEETDPFDVFDIRPPSSRPMFQNSEPASEKQISLLRKFGVPFAFGGSKADAQGLIAECLKRSREKKATFKQIAYLRRLGHPDPTDMSFSEASETIEVLRKGVPA
jgi:superfamily II DNA or RNA helicase